ARSFAPLSGRDRLAAVAPFHGFMETVFRRVLLEPYALGRMPRDAVEQGRNHLRAGETHVFVGLVDHQFLHHQLVFWYARHAPGKRIDGLIEILRGYRLVDESHLLRGLAIYGIAGQQHALRLLCAQPVHPHRGGRATPDARRHVADLRILGHDHDVRAERDVAATCHRITVHLADHRLVAAPDGEEIIRVGLHATIVAHRVPGHRLVPAIVRTAVPAVLTSLGELLQVIAG